MKLLNFNKLLAPSLLAIPIALIPNAPIDQNPENKNFVLLNEKEKREVMAEMCNEDILSPHHPCHDLTRFSILRFADNCYEYALGSKPDTDQADPGNKIGHYYQNLNFSNNKDKAKQIFINLVKADGLKQINSPEETSPDHYPIALYISDQKQNELYVVHDYHFVKKDQENNQYSQKFGSSKNSKVEIFKSEDGFPHEIDSAYKNAPYRLIAYFEVPNEGYQVGSDEFIKDSATDKVCVNYNHFVTNNTRNNKKVPHLKYSLPIEIQEKLANCK
ncbi:MAG: hypothetical protein MK033_11445 [Candidatus Caenarcaniphilales bacterium]|nr:hypothetical protein [Candidatus Caenarcaniphilales bacterium]